MKRLSVAIMSAHRAAGLNVSFEARLDEVIDQTVSLEAQMDEIDEMTQLASGLESLVASVESIDTPSYRQLELGRSQAHSLLRMSGLSNADCNDIFPSLEADAPQSGWEKFKAFLWKLWEMIKAAAMKIYNFIDNVLKSSTVAEKAAILRLRDLRRRLRENRNGLTRQAKVALRPAHAYLIGSKTPNGQLTLSVPASIEDVNTNIAQWIRSRDVIQDRLPTLLKRAAEDLRKAVDSLALNGTDEEVTASISRNADSIYDAIDPLVGGHLKTGLNLGEAGSYDMCPLIFDRVLRFNGVSDADEGREYEDLSDTDREALLASYGVTVEQDDVADPLEGGDKFIGAKGAAAVEALLKTAEKLIDEGHSADQTRKWNSLRRELTLYGGAITAVLKGVLKRENLGQDERKVIVFALHANRAMARWASAPYAQINTLNLRVVNSVLALADDFIKNLDVADTDYKEDKKPKKDDKSKKGESDEHVESARNRD